MLFGLLKIEFPRLAFPPEPTDSNTPYLVGIFVSSLRPEKELTVGVSGHVSAPAKSEVLSEISLNELAKMDDISSNIDDEQNYDGGNGNTNEGYEEQLDRLFRINIPPVDDATAIAATTTETAAATTDTATAANGASATATIFSRENNDDEQAVEIESDDHTTRLFKCVDCKYEIKDIFNDWCLVCGGQMMLTVNSDSSSSYHTKLSAVDLIPTDNTFDGVNFIDSSLVMHSVHSDDSNSPRDDNKHTQSKNQCVKCGGSIKHKDSLCNYCYRSKSNNTKKYGSERINSNNNNDVNKKSSHQKEAHSRSEQNYNRKWCAGDWICDECSEHCFYSRTKCRNCGLEPRKNQRRTHDPEIKKRKLDD